MRSRAISAVTFPRASPSSTSRSTGTTHVAGSSGPAWCGVDAHVPSSNAVSIWDMTAYVRRIRTIVVRGRLVAAVSSMWWVSRSLTAPTSSPISAQRIPCPRRIPDVPRRASSTSSDSGPPTITLRLAGRTTCCRSGPSTLPQGKPLTTAASLTTSSNRWSTAPSVARNRDDQPSPGWDSTP